MVNKLVLATLAGYFVLNSGIAPISPSVNVSLNPLEHTVLLAGGGSGDAQQKKIMQPNICPIEAMMIGSRSFLTDDARYVDNNAGTGNYVARIVIACNAGRLASDNYILTVQLISEDGKNIVDDSEAVSPYRFGRVEDAAIIHNGEIIQLNPEYLPGNVMLPMALYMKNNGDSIMFNCQGIVITPHTIEYEEGIPMAMFSLDRRWAIRPPLENLNGAMIDIYGSGPAGWMNPDDPRGKFKIYLEESTPPASPRNVSSRRYCFPNYKNL